MKAKLYPVSSDTEVSEAVEAARAALNAHETVIIPTDTVYGIACDAFSHRGVAKLLADKGRSRTMPPPVMIFDQAALSGVADEIPDEVLELGRAFWPGALTVILYAYPSLSWDLGDTQGTVAVRVPDDEFALKLLAEHGPLAVSSANKTGQPAAQDAQQAAEQLGEDVTLIVDGGTRPVPVHQPAEANDGQTESADTAASEESSEAEEPRKNTATEPNAQALPSTILDCTSTPFVVVREGAIPVAELRTVVPSIVTRAELDARKSQQTKERAAQRQEREAVESQEGLDEAYQQWDQDHSDEKNTSEPARRAEAPVEGSVASALMDAMGMISETAAAAVSAGIDQKRTRGYRNNTPQPVKSNEEPVNPVSIQQARALVFGE